MSRSTIELANEHVGITSVLERMGISTPETSSGVSWKSHCPFESYYHIDGGRAKSLRVYFDSNTAFCFAGCGYLTPVKLFSLKTGLAQLDAAEILLSQNGYELPSFEDELEGLLKIKPGVSKAALREALQTFCARLAGDSWRSVQFDDYVLVGLSNCLTILDKIDDELKARNWLELSKKYMSEILKGPKNV